MHAIQFAINVYGSGWLMESHASWAEDAVYDDVNDWHWCINSFLAAPELPIFNRYQAFAPAEYLHDISDFTTDAPSIVESIRPLRSRTRATHSSHQVSIAVTASTNRLYNGAPYGLGANFIDFINAPGSVAVSFDGTDGFAWRAYVIATPTGGGKTAVLPVTLDAGSAGSITVDGMGTRWPKLTMAVTIADRPGIAVPYSYRAAIARGPIAD